MAGSLGETMVLDWQRLVRMSDEELAQLDISVTNLACAAGLPGSERIDVPLCLRTLDTWAEQTHRFTERVMPMFHRGRCDYPDSEPRFRIQAMITYLQRDLGIQYPPDKRSDDALFESSDSFLHGIIETRGGTCASLPVLYVAIGRRLGYPLTLATARRHLYVRWDGSPSDESFNIEASGEGVSFFPDEHYRTGGFQMLPEAIRFWGFLRSLSPREEVACFLRERAGCWVQVGNFGEAVIALAWTYEADPSRESHKMQLIYTMQEWDKRLRARLPSREFPNLDIGLPAPHFLRIPREVEREIIRMKVMENVLNDPSFNRRWWEPLRLNPHHRPAGLPHRLSLG